MIHIPSRTLNFVVSGAIEKLIRAIANGCEVKMVDAEGIKEIEPHCVGLRAIHSPLTGFYKYKDHIKRLC